MQAKRPGIIKWSRQWRLIARSHRRSCLGFTLLESLISTGILLVAIIAISSAVTAGQQHAFEAQLRISGTIAADELMSRLDGVAYGNLVSTWHEFEENPGEMQTMQGDAFPESFARIGRRVNMAEANHTLPGVNVTIRGLLIQVEAFDDRDNTLVTLARFVPEPPHITVPGVDDDDALEASSTLRSMLDELDATATGLGEPPD